MWLHSQNVCGMIKKVKTLPQELTAHGNSEIPRGSRQGHAGMALTCCPRE